MAGADYIKCENCAERLIYLPEGSVNKVYCAKCYKRIEKKYKKLKKALKR